MPPTHASDTYSSSAYYVPCFVPGSGGQNGKPDRQTVALKGLMCKATPPDIYLPVRPFAITVVRVPRLPSACRRTLTKRGPCRRHQSGHDALSRSSPAGVLPQPAPRKACAGALTGPGSHKAILRSDGCYQNGDLRVHDLIEGTSKAHGPRPFGRLVLKPCTKIVATVCQGHVGGQARCYYLTLLTPTVSPNLVI